MPHTRPSESWKISCRYKGDLWRISSLVSYLLLLWSGPSVGEGWDSASREETLCHLWRWEGGTVRYNQQGDRGGSRDGHNLRMDGERLASLLLAQIINPALLAAEFRVKQEGNHLSVRTPLGNLLTDWTLCCMFWHSFSTLHRLMSVLVNVTSAGLHQANTCSGLQLHKKQIIQSIPAFRDLSSMCWPTCFFSFQMTPCACHHQGEQAGRWTTLL